MPSLTHFDAQGQAHMVDIAAKPATHRIAVASGRIDMLPATLALIEADEDTAQFGAALRAMIEQPELSPIAASIMTAAMTTEGSEKIGVANLGDDTLLNEITVQNIGDDFVITEEEP